MPFFISLFLILSILIQFTNARWEQQGMTFTNGKYCPEVQFGTQAANYSLEQLQSTGANFVSIVVTQYQKTENCTHIFPLYTPQKSSYYTYVTATREQLIQAINKAHSLNLNVMLKLQIDLTEDDDHWRGDIGEHFNKQEWNDWFNSYYRALAQYARLAEELKVKQFSVGCELIAVSPQAGHWRKLISDIREIYTGTIVYSSNWGYLDSRGGEETHKTWWDAVDIMGIDAYYPICNNITNPTLSQLKEGWKPVLARYQNLTKHFNRPIMLSEIGFCSGECKRNQQATQMDFIEQATHYQAVFETFLKVDFPFLGIFWWTWNTDPASGKGLDTCITPQNKPAEQMVRRYYGGKTKLPKWKGQPVCECTV